MRTCFLFSLKRGQPSDGFLISVPVFAVNVDVSARVLLRCRRRVRKAAEHEALLLALEEELGQDERVAGVVAALFQEEQLLGLGIEEAPAVVLPARGLAAVIPDLFHLPTITWFQAWCLAMLCSLLFKTSVTTSK